MTKYFDTSIVLTTVQLIVLTVNCSNRLPMTLSIVIVLKNERVYLVNNPVKQSPKERLCHCISGSDRLEWENVITYSNFVVLTQAPAEQVHKVHVQYTKLTISHLVSKAGDSTTTRSRCCRNRKTTRVLYNNHTDNWTPFSHPSAIAIIVST